MKKIFITMLFSAISLFSFAQKKAVSVGIKAGVTFPTISSTGDASPYDGSSGTDFKTNTSFYIGGTVDIPVSALFSVQPGLTLAGKGAKSAFSQLRPDPADGYNLYQGDRKISTMYVEIPVNAVFNFQVGEGKVFVGAGPYYGVAIAGQIKMDGVVTRNETTRGESSKRDIVFGGNGDLKRNDFGLNFLAGYQLKSGLNIHAGYGLGLSKIDTYTGAEPTWANRVLSVGVGFAF